MNSTDSQPVTEQEDSSISITYQELWTKARNISRPASPSELSVTSEQVSQSREFSVPTTSSVHPNPEPITTYHLHPNISHPSTRLPLPKLPLPTASIPVLPKRTMTHATYEVSPLAQMPVRGTKHAPPTFKGEYRRVSRFIDHYTHLLQYYQVTSDYDKCKGILEYCSQDVEDFIVACPDFINPKWEALKNEILKYYDAERMETRIQLSDFVRFLQDQSRTTITNLSQWKKYNRKYLAQAGFLKRNNQIEETEYQGYFWYAIPEDLRIILEVKLQTKYPTYDTAANPWSIAQVQEVAEGYLKRNTYSDKLYHLPALGVKKRYEEEDDDEDDEYEEDDEDEEIEERRIKRKKKLTKKKQKPITNPIKGLPAVQILKEEPSRRIIPPPDNHIEDMIHQLNTMSLEDPRYGSLYYKAIKNDRTGLVAQCIQRKPIQATPGRLASKEVPFHQDQSPQNPIRPPYLRGVLPQMPGQFISKCYGCFETGHRLRDCPKMANLIYKGIVTLDNKFRYQFPDGETLYRKPDESFVQTIERMRPTQHQVQYVSVGEAVEKFYSKAAKRNYKPDSDSETDEEESEDSDSDSDADISSDDEEEEEEPYEEGHWTWRSKRRHEFPTYVAYEAIDEDEQPMVYEAYPVDRSDKATREARTTAMNNPIRKTKFDGVYMPPRRTYGPENDPVKAPTRNPNPVPASIKPNNPPSKPPVPFKPKENILPDIAPIPVDARKPRIIDSKDIEMKDPESAPKAKKDERKPITLQDYPPRTRPTEAKSNELQLEKARAGPRQSELSTQIDSKAVVEQILDTQVSLPLRNILGASKELSSNFQDVIRYKNPNPKPVTSFAIQEVLNSEVQQQPGEVRHMEDGYEPDYDEEDLPENKELIRLVLYCNGRPITAVIDTGSQLNIVSEAMANKLIQLPINLVENVVMGDANGNSDKLNGLIKKVPLRCGEVLTEASLYIARKKLPFDLLLGRPWQKGNHVTIDERRKGTYLIFKDRETDDPKFEIFINPAQFYPRDFKPFKRGVYTAIESARNVLNSTSPNLGDLQQNSFLILHHNGNTVSAQIDMGSKINMISPTAARKLTSLPIEYTDPVIMIDDKNTVRRLNKVIRRVPLTYGQGKVRIETDLYVADEQLSSELIIGALDARHLSTEEIKLPEEYCAEQSADPVNAGDPKIEQNTDEELTQDLLNRIQRFNLEIDEEVEEEFVESTFPAIQTCLAKMLEKEQETLDVEKEKMSGTSNIEREECCASQEYGKEPSQENPSHELPTRPEVKGIQLVEEQIGKQEKQEDILPEKDSGENSDHMTRSTCSQGNAECTCRVMELIAKESEPKEPRNCLSTEIEEGTFILPTRNCQCGFHSLDNCSQGEKTEEYAEQPLECQEGKKCEPEYLGMEPRSDSRSACSNFEKANNCMVGGGLNTARKIQERSEINPQAMPTVSTAYTPSITGPVDSESQVPVSLLASVMARIHGQDIVNRTDYSHIPPAPLRLTTESALLATNQQIPEEGTNTSFAYAELASLDTKLTYTINGTTHTVKGDAYIQFSYFMADPDGQHFLNTFNANPPYPPDHNLSTNNPDMVAEPDCITASGESLCAPISETDPKNSQLPNNDNQNLPTSSSALLVDDEICPPVGQKGGTYQETIARIKKELNITTEDPSQQEEGRPSLPDGQASVYFAAVADPLLSQRILRPRLPSRLQRITPAPIIIDNGYANRREEQREQENAESDVEMETFTLLKRPNTALGMPSLFLRFDEARTKVNTEGYPHPSRTVTMPKFILAYGPFITQTPLNPLHPFEYHVYLHYIPQTLGTPFKIAYGSFPHTTIDYLDLERMIDEQFVAGLDQDQLHFVLFASQLYTQRHLDTTPDRFQVNPQHLLQGWIPPSANRGTVISYRYPLVERLLSLTTYLIHLPDGQYAQYLRKYHLEVADELYTFLAEEKINHSLEDEVDEPMPSSSSTEEIDELESTAMDVPPPAEKLTAEEETFEDTKFIPNGQVPLSTPTAPDYVLGYGPFLAEDTPLHPPYSFIYRAFLHHIPKSLRTAHKIAYGNYVAYPVKEGIESFPFVPFDYLILDNTINEAFINQLDTEQLQFLLLAVQLYTQHSPYDTLAEFTIDTKLLVQGWTPSTSDDANPTHRYPLVESLMSLATHLIHSPDGQLAKHFQDQHRDVAREMSTLIREGNSGYQPMVRQFTIVINLNSPNDYNDQESDSTSNVPPPLYPSVDHEMSDITSDDDDDDDESDGLVEVDHAPGATESENGWNTKAVDKEFWNREDNGWGIKLTHPPRRHIEIRSNKDSIDTSFKGPLGTEPGILAYGPFNTPSETHRNLPEERDYRMFVHTTDGADVLDYFAYGGNGFKDGKDVTVLKLPISAVVANSTLPPVFEHEELIHMFEAYLNGDERYQHGVQIPNKFLVGGRLMVNQQDGFLHYRYPIVEQIMSKLAARCNHPRLAHPFGQLQLNHMRQLVSPEFPANKGLPIRSMFTPDLPYIQVKFDPNEDRHAEDTVSDFMYFGCLPRKFAYPFLTILPKYTFHLYSATCATYHLFLLHADPALQPKVDPNAKINWDELLEPHSFREIFPFEKPSRLAATVSNPNLPNHWIQRLPYILQCTRQLNQLIRFYESFFKSLGFEGLREIVETVGLNTSPDYVHNMLLEGDEVVYLTALYDFLLREHATNLAQMVLRILHVPFRHPYQLSTCRDHIINAIEPPIYSYIIRDYM
jgi:hypothetical protein